MATNTNLTQELAVKLMKSQPVTCPNCEKSILTPRYGHKNQNTEYKCTVCGEIFHPCKLI